MTYPLLPFHSLLFLGATALTLGFSTPAEACSGLERTELLTVPLADSLPVPLDTLPLVIGGARTLTLRSEGGTTVPINVVTLGRVQPPGVIADASPHWQAYTVRRLIPTEELEPSTEYTVGVPASAGDSADAGTGAPQDIGTFLTAASGELNPEPQVPSSLALSFYSFGAGDEASCSGSGQLEVEGWQDNTLLELCVDYFTYTRYVEPQFQAEVEFDDRPERQRRCTLAWRPSAHVLEEAQPVLWVESVAVRAFGLGGSVSPAVVFERADLGQFNADLGVDGLAVEPFTPLELPSPECEATEQTEDNLQSEQSDAGSAQGEPVVVRGRSGCSLSATKHDSQRAWLWFVLLLGVRRRRSPHSA